MRTRAQPLIAIDLALTHDFDPAVGELDGVELLTLESVRLAAPQEQAESLAQASSIVSGAAVAFEQEREVRSVDSAIVALRRHTMNVLDAEMEKVRARHGCTAAAEEVEFALRRMVKQLLHVPTVRARELASNGQQDDYVAALETLYGITVEPQPAAAAKAECPVDHSQLATRHAPGSRRIAKPRLTSRTDLILFRPDKALIPSFRPTPATAVWRPPGPPHEHPRP